MVISRECHSAKQRVREEGFIHKNGFFEHVQHSLLLGTNRPDPLALLPPGPLAVSWSDHPAAVMQTARRQAAAHSLMFPGTGGQSGASTRKQRSTQTSRSTQRCAPALGMGIMRTCRHSRARQACDGHKQLAWTDGSAGQATSAVRPRKFIRDVWAASSNQHH